MKIKGDIELSIVIPGFNEERNIEAATLRCLQAMNRLGIIHELILVNDGSTDRTGEIADSLAIRFPSIRVIHNSVNLNVGIAILIGMRSAKGRFVTHNAMDLPFAPEDYGQMAKHFDTADVVIAVRKDRAAHSIWRKVTSLVHCWLVRIAFLINIRDLNFVQAYRREALRALGVKARSPAFTTPELIIRAKRQGFRIVEFDAEFHRRRVGVGNFGKPRDILWTLSDLVSFWLESTGRNNRR